MTRNTAKLHTVLGSSKDAELRNAKPIPKTMTLISVLMILTITPHTTPMRSTRPSVIQKAPEVRVHERLRD